MSPLASGDQWAFLNLEVIRGQNTHIFWPGESLQDSKLQRGKPHATKPKNPPLVDRSLLYFPSVGAQWLQDTTGVPGTL